MRNRIVQITFAVISFVMIATAPTPAEAKEYEQHNNNVHLGFYPAYESGGSYFYADMYAPTEENPYEWAPCDERCGYLGLKEGVYYTPADGEVVQHGYIFYTGKKGRSWSEFWDGSFQPYKKTVTVDGKHRRLKLTSASLDIYNPAVPEPQYNSPCEMKCK